MIKFESVSKSFEKGEMVVDNLTFEIEQGEFLTLLGPSGCGKTTCLRMIGGFEDPTKGDILFDGKSILGIPPFKRPVNTVFQNYALFPHLNVKDNISFGLKNLKKTKQEMSEVVGRLLDLVQLPGSEYRRVQELSGGQKQRIAIARALAMEPKVLLLDEPLGALDLKLRKQMQSELKSLQKKLGITFLYVTHDQEEALSMSDRIAVMNQGCMEQLATPQEIYDHPATKFVAEFVGETNILECVVTQNVSADIISSKVRVKLPFQENGSSPFPNDSRTFLCLRPEDIHIVPKTDGAKPNSTHKEMGSENRDSFNSFEAQYREKVFIGNGIRYIFDSDHGSDIVVFESDDEYDLNPGETVDLRWDIQDTVLVKG